MNWPSRSVFNRGSNYALAVVSEVLGPAFRIWSRVKTGSSTPMATWKRLLVVGDSHVGDLLYRSASLPVLKAGLPGCEIHFLARAGASEVLMGNPGIDSVDSCRRSDNILELEAVDWKRLKELNFDAILCTGAVSGWREMVLGLRLGIPNRIGYAHRGFSCLLTHAFVPEHPRPYPEYVRDLVAQLLGKKAGWDVRPKVFPDIQNRSAAELLWKEFGYSDEEVVVACFVTTRQSGGSWPVDWFGQVARALQQRTQCRLVLCGALGDKAILESLGSRFSLKTEINAGRLGLRALVSFLTKCGLVLSQDSGPRHMGNAAGIPIVYARNIRVSALETGSYLDTEHDVVPPGIERVPPQLWKDVHALVTPEQGTDIAEAALRSRAAR